MTITELSNELRDMLDKYGNNEKVIKIIASKTLAKKPCFKCEDRTIGCHGYCNDYINFQWANNYFLNLKREITNTNRYFKNNK